MAMSFRSKYTGLWLAFQAVVRLHWIALTVLAVLVVFYALAGFFLAPQLARSAAQDYLARELGRRLLIKEVRFNPFTLQAVVDNLELSEADGSHILGFKSLLVNFELASIWRRGIVLKEVRLQDPVVKLIVQRDGSVNLAQLVPSRPQAPAQESQGLPRVRIGSLGVINGRIDLEDRTHATPFTEAFTRIQLALSDFRADVDYKNAYSFSSTTSDGEQLEWSGNFTVQPFGSTGRFSIQGLRAQTLDSYAQERLPFKLASGTASLSGDYRVALDPKLALDVTVPNLALRDLTLKERAAAQQDVPLSLPHVDVSGATFSYAKRELTIKEVSATGAHVEVRREPDGSVNLLRLFAAAPPPSTTRPADAAAFAVRIDTIRLGDGAVIVEDRAVAPATRFELKPVALTVNGWSTDPAAKMRIDSQLVLNKQGRLQLNGQAQLEPLTAELAIKLSDFPLPVLQPYIAQTAAMTLHSGRLGVSGRAAYAASSDAVPAIRFTGEVDVADLRTTDHLVNQDFVKWNSLNVGGIDFSQSPGKLTIDRITARQPYARVVIAKDQTLNVAKVLRPQPEARDGEALRPPTRGASAQRKAAAGGASPTFPVRIKNVRVIDGSADFADYSIEPSFAAGIVGLNGTVIGLSSDPASRAKVLLAGKVDKYAPVNISGEVNLLSAAKYTDIAMNFRNIELTTFNPYSGKFAGYSINKGKLSTKLKYKVENRVLNAEHHIIVDNLEFGDKTDSKDAAPIPIRLAVALLKDRHGVIDLQLPVRGTLDDPTFRLAPIIWKAVLGLLTKIVTAPFAAIGALFGGGDELAYVDFPAGVATLSAPELQKLEKLAKALIERPQLRLDVPLTIMGGSDSEALARKAIEERAPPATTGEQDAAAKRRRVGQLEGIYRGIAKAAPEYPPETRSGFSVDWDARLRWIDRALLDKLRPDQAALDALARERAQAVQVALLAHTGIDPQRIFITNERKGSATPNGTVRMEMKLE